MTIRTAMVGTGGRAHGFARAAAISEDMELVACYAPTPVRREPFAEQYGISAYDSLDEMLESEKPDIVHIVTWPDARLEPMRTVAAHGIPACTVEKPVAVGVDDYRELLQIEAESDTRFAISHQLRWHADLTRCREAVAQGVIGEPFHVEMTAGMNVAGQGTHVLDYGLSLVGDPEVVRVVGTVFGTESFVDAHSGPDGFVAQLELDGGITAEMVLGVTAPRIGGDPDVEWMHVRVAATGPKGRVEYREFGDWWIQGIDVYETGHCGSDEDRRLSNITAQAEFHRRLAAWARGEGPEVGTSLRNALEQWKVILAVYQSALDRSPVTVSDFEPESDLIERLRKELGSV